ncbi:histidine phosphatase family protein [Candidatus Uhrbacteria bacterium]|nr:histidine phosphatase family protein [Candidatus Uhrbacteria bacterium]
MTTIYLMRHGFVDNPKNLFYGPEFVLSERGQEQISLLANDILTANIRPKIIFFSPFLRTHQTAQIIASTLGVTDIRVDARLREWDVGKWFDRPIVEFYQATGYDADPPPEQLPNGVESLVDLGKRVSESILELARACQGDVGMVVSHREALVAGLLHFQGNGFSAIHRIPFYRGMVWKLCFNDRFEFVEASQSFDRSMDTW